MPGITYWSIFGSSPYRENPAPLHRLGSAVATAQLDDRTILITGSSDNTIRTWDLATNVDS
jgi:WD40 repeat protein